MKKNTNWHKNFFKKYYLVFLASRKATFDTKTEVNFICGALKIKKGAKILDLACGYCRHGIELAKKGFSVTCLDFHKKALSIGKKEAKEKHVSLRLIEADMRDIPFKNEFDAVVNIFSSYGYFEKETENMNVLKAVSRALKKGGVFLLDLPNKNWMLTMVSKKTWQKINNFYFLEERYFDKKSNIYINDIMVITSDKKIKQTATRMHLYEFLEIKEKLNKFGFKVLRTYGDYKGEKYDPTLSPRMIVVAELK